MKNLLPTNSFRIGGSHFTQVGRDRTVFSLWVQRTLVSAATADAVVPGAVRGACSCFGVIGRIFFSRATHRGVQLRVAAEAAAAALVHGKWVVVNTLQAAVRVTVHGVGALQGTVL